MTLPPTGDAAIVHMTTWGAAGNARWAERLAARLRSQGRTPRLFCADPPGSFFHAAGERLRGAKQAPTSRRREEVLKWATSIDVIVREASSARDASSLLPSQLVDLLSTSTNVDLYATKGVLARVLQRIASVARWRSLYHFVTNPGLTSLDLHRAKEAQPLVPYKDWVTYVHRHIGITPAVFPVPEADEPVADARTESVLPKLQAEASLVILLASDDGHPWLELLRAVPRVIAHAHVLFVGVRSPSLVEAARSLARELGLVRFSATDWLAPAVAARDLRTYAGRQRALVVTKPGPATVRLLAGSSVPIVLWDAQLPFEDWVMASAIRAGAHLPARHLDEVCEALHRFSDDPQGVYTCARSDWTPQPHLDPSERDSQPHLDLDEPRPQ